MTSTGIELLLVAIAAMLSPTTLSFCLFALLLGDRPKRTGSLFYLGAFGATVAVGLLADVVLGDVAAVPENKSPKTWVLVIDIVAGLLLLVWVARVLRRPADPRRTQSVIDRMSSVASSPWIAVVAAGATLANPGGFIPLALKDISQLNPSTAEFALLWLAFTVISLLPLLLALVALVLAPEPTTRMLHRSRGWLERNLRIVAAVIVVLLAAALLRNGIAGLVG
ncbi:MAG TPA: GAP family protein [Solirubrobacteraceae bacterium]|nr:GAP family protein [Solirubrobacteraceae bacterium]